MSENKENLIKNSTFLKPTATSTVEKDRKKKPSHISQDSIGILSNIDCSSFLDKYISKEENLSELLNKQRQLASSSLKRLSTLPSEYLKPNHSENTQDSSLSGLSSSTISESDLLSIPRNRSTPRSSMIDEQKEKFAQLTLDVQNPENYFKNVAEEFESILNMPENCTTNFSFIPAEEAKSRLMADELSWRKKNDLPAALVSIASENSAISDKMSMGEYFFGKSNDISDLKNARTPMKSKPAALISETLHETIPDVSGVVLYETSKPAEKDSLSISQIQKMLQGENTPKTVLNMIFKKPLDSDQESDIAIPLSKNSSYTSDYSVNEALQNIQKKSSMPKVEENSKTKTLESRSTTSASQETSTQSRTSSCLCNFPNKKLPIESTNSELTWGCVKVDRCVTKDFLIRNKSPKSIRIQCSISGSNFKIRKDRNDSDPLSAAKVFLHGHESRPIIVSFIPTTNGPAAEELLFTSLDAPSQQLKKQAVKLFGYGGYTNIEFQSVSKDLSGRYLLTLGRMDNSPIITKTFYFKNTGNLASFCYLQFIKKEFDVFSKVMVTPNFFSIAPGETKEVTLTYEPTSNDVKHLQNIRHFVVELGHIQVISGAEVNRGRLRRLCKKAFEAGVELDPMCQILKEKISGEAIPSDVTRLKDGLVSLKDILQLFNKHEIITTIEQDPEQTLMPQYQDDSHMFATLCGESTIVENTMLLRDYCKLEPNNIILTPPTKNKDSLFLISENTKVLHYEVQSSPEGLEVIPKEGILPPGETVVLQVSYNKCLTHKQIFKVVIYVDNEVLEADVKVLYLSKKTH